MYLCVLDWALCVICVVLHLGKFVQLRMWLERNSGGEGRPWHPVCWSLLLCFFWLTYYGSVGWGPANVFTLWFHLLNEEFLEVTCCLGSGNILIMSVKIIRVSYNSLLSSVGFVFCICPMIHVFCECTLKGPMCNKEINEKHSELITSNIMNDWRYLIENIILCRDGPWPIGHVLVVLCCWLCPVVKPEPPKIEDPDVIFDIYVSDESAQLQVRFPAPFISLIVLSVCLFACLF